MHKKEIEWRLGNLKTQVQEHLRNEEKLAGYSASVYVEQTMRKAAEKQIAQLEAKLT